MRPKKSFDDDEGAAFGMASGVDAAGPSDADADGSALAIAAELTGLAGDVEVVGAFLQPARIASATRQDRHRIEITFGDYTPSHLELSGRPVLDESGRAEVAEWQTQRIQNPPSLRVCGFKSHLRYRFSFQRFSFKKSAEISGFCVVQKHCSTAQKPRATSPGLFMASFVLAFALERTGNAE